MKIDVDQRKIAATVAVDGTPDAIDYDPLHDYVVATLGGAKELASVDVKTLKVVGTVKLPGSPELMAMDGKGRGVDPPAHAFVKSNVGGLNAELNAR